MWVDDERKGVSVAWGQERMGGFSDCEILPHLPEVRMDRSKDKAGHEINLSRNF